MPTQRIEPVNAILTLARLIEQDLFCNHFGSRQPQEGMAVVIEKRRKPVYRSR